MKRYSIHHMIIASTFDKNRYPFEVDMKLFLIPETESKNCKLYHIHPYSICSKSGYKLQHIGCSQLLSNCEFFFWRGALSFCNVLCHFEAVSSRRIDKLQMRPTNKSKQHNKTVDTIIPFQVNENHYFLSCEINPHV